MKRLATLLLASVCSLALSGSAFATSICSDCSATFQLSINGQDVGGGALPVDDNGNIDLLAPFGFEGDGFSISLSALRGNVDPTVAFGLGAVNNTDAPMAFAFAFSLPISLGGVISASAAVGYSLTDISGAGATLFPLVEGGKVVSSQDIRIEPLLITNKGVDIGDACTVGTPPGSDVCGPFSANAIFGSVGGPTYDLMSVIVAFGLTPRSAAGLSGLVIQTAVPEPGTLLLLGSGLVGLIGFARRSD